MNASAPVVDTAAKTVTHAGTTFTMRPLSENAVTVLVAGIPVGRVVFSFGAANAVVESPDVTEAVLDAVGEAWFAALEAQGAEPRFEPSWNPVRGGLLAGRAPLAASAKLEISLDSPSLRVLARGPVALRNPLAQGFRTGS